MYCTCCFIWLGQISTIKMVQMGASTSIHAGHCNSLRCTGPKTDSDHPVCRQNDRQNQAGLGEDTKNQAGSGVSSQNIALKKLWMKISFDKELISQSEDKWAEMMPCLCLLPVNFYDFH